MRRPHSLHIPVMGTGFTLLTPLRVARYGIASVISLVDDDLLERQRAKLCERHAEPYEPIGRRDPDARARRTRAYLDLIDRLVGQQLQALVGGSFEPGSDLCRYFELLPEGDAKARYRRMREMEDEGARARLQAELRADVRAGAIDVNIMTKLDRAVDPRGEPLPFGDSDALAALRGFAESTLASGVVLSAGMNARLYGYIASFDDFFPDAEGRFRKTVILKVSSYRSAEIQGRFLAKRGVWVSEYRIESGLNCGGHAFAGEGALLGPTLEDFAREREPLRAKLFVAYAKALAGLGRGVPTRAPDVRVTVQGGIGTAEEDALMREEYGADGTGWGTPFLLVPEATSVDDATRARLLEARAQDVRLSGSSPLGVPFWNLMTSGSEEARRGRIAAGRPGSPCPLGHVASDTRFSRVPACPASREYQRRALAEPDASVESVARVLDKSCICHDLGGGVRLEQGLSSGDTPAICPGPNLVNFDRLATLDEMVGHVYGRLDLGLPAGRPHMLARELELFVEHLHDGVAALDAERGELDAREATRREADLEALRAALIEGIAHYRARGARPGTRLPASLLAALDALEAQLGSTTQAAPGSGPPRAALGATPAPPA